MRRFIILGLVNFVVLSTGLQQCPDNIKEQDIIDTCLPLDPVIYPVVTDKNKLCTAALSMLKCVDNSWSGCAHLGDDFYALFIPIMQQKCEHHFDAFYNEFTPTRKPCVGQDIAVNYQELSAKCPITHPTLRALVNRTNICDNFHKVLNCAKQKFPLCSDLIKTSFMFYGARPYGCKKISKQEVLEEVELKEIKDKLDKIIEEVVLKISQIDKYRRSNSQGGNDNRFTLDHKELNMQEVFDKVVELKEIKAGLGRLIKELALWRRRYLTERRRLRESTPSTYSSP